MADLDPWYLDHLVDPVDKSRLSWTGAALRSEGGREYPVVDGVPVMLVPDVEQTLDLASASVRRSRGALIDGRAPHLYLETVGISEAEKLTLLDLVATGRNRIDPIVLMLLGATSGYAYEHLVGSDGLAEYPIPSIRLPPGGGKRLLDVGCSWGRWSIAAARAGYDVVGLDPSIGAIMAARRVAAELSLGNRYVVGDGRLLPFPDGSLDACYSYSVIQHFSPADARTAVGEIGRVLVSGGTATVQLANTFGLRSIQHQARRGFREPEAFEVRYYSPRALRALFAGDFAKVDLSTDCYFGLGWQISDLRHMKPGLKPILLASEALKRLSDVVTPLRFVADSLFCEAVKT
jgi:SAM-dependent methyltransferase/uncharacterized protein YbaR (Trm112 family)